MEAKGRPETIFKQEFYDVREKVKGIKKNWEQEAGDKLEKQVLDDLNSKNVSVIEHKFSLGKYRGSRFVTSFKLKVQVKNQKEAEDLVNYLKKYSPKWRLNKISDDGVAELNLRGKDIMQNKVARELLHIAKNLIAEEELDRSDERRIKKVLFEAYDIIHDYRKGGYKQLESIEGHLEEAIAEFRKL